MENKKKKKILKICGWVGFGVLIALIIAICSLSLHYKNQTNDLKNKNDEIEEVLGNSFENSLNQTNNFVAEVLID